MRENRGSPPLQHVCGLADRYAFKLLVEQSVQLGPQVGEGEEARRLNTRNIMQQIAVAAVPPQLPPYANARA
jgi:hypothetical protein